MERKQMCQPRILNLVKIYFKNKGGINVRHTKGKKIY